MSARDALMAYSEGLLKKSNREKKTYKSPEKDMVNEILKWCRSQKMDLNVIESSGGVNKYGGVTVKSGYSDISGNDKHGYAVYIEAKAKGKRSTLKGHQYQFLLRKIKSGAFAMVVDNVDSLGVVYYGWLELRENGEMARAKKYLIDNLYIPKSVRDDKKELFD